MPQAVELRKKRVIEMFYAGGDVRLDPESRLLFTACGNVVKVLNSTDATEKFVIGDPEGEQRVTAFGLSKDAGFFVAAFSNDLIQLFDLNEDSATVVKQFRGNHAAPILLLEFSPDGTSLATGGADSVVRIFDVKRGFCTHVFKSKSNIVSAFCYYSASKLLAGYANGVVRHFDLTKSGVPHVDFKCHSSQITEIVQSGDEAIFVSRDQTYTIINVVTNEKVKTIPIFESIEAAVLLPNGNLVTGGEEGVLKQIIPSSGRQVKKSKICNQQIDLILLNEVDETLLCVTSDHVIVTTDFEFSVVNQFAGFNDEIFDAAFVGPETNCLVVGTNSPDLRLYSTQTWSCQVVSGHQDCVLSVASPSWDNYLFATSSKDNSIIFWNVFPPGHVHDNVDEKPNTKAIERGLYDVRQLGIAPGHTASVPSIRFSHSNKKGLAFLVSVSDDNTLKLWPLKDLFEDQKSSETKKLTATATLVAHTQDVTCVEVAPNDQLCATASMDKTVRLWHIDRQIMKLGIAGTLSGHRRGIWSLKFAPDAHNLITCGGDSTVRVFNLIDKTCIRTLEGHNFGVVSAMFLEKGTQLLTADAGGIFKIWEMKSGECLKTQEAHDEKIWNIETLPNSADPEGRPGYITVGADARIVCWEDATDEMKQETLRKNAERVADLQKLSNFMEQEKFAEALVFALDLRHPYDCLKVINKITENNHGDKLEPILASLREEQLTLLLDYASQWNTNTRTYSAAQIVLNALLKSVHPEKILQMPGIGKVLESFIPYTNRHIDRLNIMDVNSQFINYLFQSMHVV